MQLTKGQVQQQKKEWKPVEEAAKVPDLVDKPTKETILPKQKSPVEASIIGMGGKL